ncbi:hypothetical protein [Anaerotruncus massiliensis (ex Liu et al. 2021)]|uniref:hypothetical protein n=1 Tax=Anaerotruncus massiliensis (ex Liu et al. 2021) TaxID=2321404 RepID=UPI003AF6EC28
MTAPHAYEIRIMHMGAVVRTYHPQGRAAARKLYRKNFDTPGQYTQLVVDGAPQSTARARRLLGLPRYV